jgi:LPXTG-site transpeptidase (sortase) family protein
VTGTDTAVTSLITVDEFGNPIGIQPPIPGVADPEVTKAASQPYVVPGGLITWTLTVRNPGSEPVAGIIITDTLDIKMTVESVVVSNGVIQSEGNTVVAVTDLLNFNDAATLTIVARVNKGVIAGALLQNVGCATSVGGSASICDTASVRVAPDAELLPATGSAAGTPDRLSGAAQLVPLITVMLALTGLLGLAVFNRKTGLAAAVVMIIVLVLAVVIALNSENEQPTTGGGGITETPTSVAAAPTQMPTAAPTLPPDAPDATAIPPTNTPVPTESVQQATAVPPTAAPPFQPLFEREIFIPKLGLSQSVPIVNIPLRNRTWDVRDLGQNVGFLQGTSWLDEAAGEYGGNTVLAGHIQITEGVPGPFRDLDLLEIGDSIFVAEQGLVTEFVVTTVDVVAPDDVAVTYPTSEQALTLITCTTWNAFRGLFAERLMVRAVPVRSMAT